MKNSSIAVFLDAMIFVIYSFLVFVFTGIGEHGIVFWLAYIYTILYMVVFGIIMFIVSKRDDGPRLLFYGYSIFIWAVIFYVLQIIISFVFIALDNFVKLELLLELMFMVAFVIIMLFCFKTKDTIEAVREDRTASTEMMKHITGLVQSAAANCPNPEARRIVEKLAEDFRYSDMVSSPETAMSENMLQDRVIYLNQIIYEDKEKIITLCTQIRKELLERNRICISSKKKY